MEYARKLMLVNRRRPLQPEQKLDIKPGMVENHDFRLRKSRLGLEWLLIIQQKLPHEYREIHMVPGQPLFHCCLRPVPGNFSSEKFSRFHRSS